MKFAFLPNYFKKVGVTGFFIFFAIIIISSIAAVINSYNILANKEFADSYELGLQIGQEFLKVNYWISKLCGTLLLLSIACYMLAKEKIEDEYMDAMRWESLRFSFIISIGITILCILFINYTLPAKSLLLLQFIAYLIVFKVKKSNALKS